MVSHLRVAKRKYSDTQRCSIVPSNVATVFVYFGAKAFIQSMPKHWFPFPNTKHFCAHFAIVACVSAALTSICTAVKQTYKGSAVQIYLICLVCTQICRLYSFCFVTCPECEHFSNWHVSYERQLDPSAAISVSSVTLYCAFPGLKIVVHLCLLYCYTYFGQLRMLFFLVINQLNAQILVL